MSEEESNYLEPGVNKVPNYEVSENAFILTQEKLTDRHEKSLQFVLDAIKKDARFELARTTVQQILSLPP